MIRYLLRILLLPALVGAFLLSPAADSKMTYKEVGKLPAHHRSIIQDNSISRRSIIDTTWKGILMTSLAAALAWKAPPPAFAAQPSRPLLRCLVSVLKIQQLSSELSNDLENGGEEVIELNGRVKYMIKDLDMRLNLEEGVLFLGGGNAREEARRHGKEALEYLSQIVEFDAYDDLKKSRSSRIALRMTPEKREFTRKAFQAAQRELKEYLAFFPRDKIKEAQLFYNQVFEPVFPED